MNVHSKKSSTLLVLVFLAIISYTTALFNLSALQMFDELIAVVSIFYLILLFFSSKGKWNKDIVIDNALITYSLLILIGLLSSIIFHLHKSWKDVIIDSFTLVKTISILIALFHLLSRDNRASSMMNYMQKLARVTVYILFIGLILGLVTNYPTAHYDKWGAFPQFKTFVFFAKYPSILAVYISTLIAFLMTDLDNKKNKNAMVLALICLIFTQSGLGLLSAFVCIILYFFFHKTLKIRWYHVILLIAGGSIVGATEIHEYLLNDTAARSLLFRYAFITANSYFPLGSGFATYGSAQAVKSYSNLYVSYGFSSRWGMGEGENSFFLNDTYYPMIIGQFGYVGTYLFFRLYFKMFKEFNKLTSIKHKASLIYLLIIIIAKNAVNSAFREFLLCFVKS